MLIVAKRMDDLNFSALMEIYSESNRENGRQMWPEETADRQLFLAEEGFGQYLREDFFPTPGALYAAWSVDGKYVSALRLEPYRDGLLLEALETAPAHRGKGYASALLQAVIAELVPGKLYSHVGKKNDPSLRTHEKAGFQRISEGAVYIDGSVDDRCCTLCWNG